MMYFRARSSLTLLICLLSVGQGLAAEASRLHRYTVQLDETLSTLQVRACFQGPTPRYLVAESFDASGALSEVRFEGSKKQLEPNGTELKLREAKENACLRYVVNAVQSMNKHEKGGNLTGHVGEDFVVDVGLWFWRPDTLAEQEDIRIEFVLPEGVTVSTPWAEEAGGLGRVFRAGRTPYDWPAIVAFGKFKEQTITVPGATLRLVVLGVTPKVNVAQITEWFRNAALGVATVHGKFPVPQARLVVIPNAHGNEPVPWAFVQRGGGPSAQFLINHRLPPEELFSDWTSFHELSHLLLPYINSEDAWLSEGTASYYQNVLRARRGVITSQDAWQRLHAGFERGRKSQVGATLADATERMYRNAGFMRVYWEGAAIALLADYRLRVRTQGRHSLDTALAGVAACCLSQEVAWHGREILKKMDEITGDTVFTELYEQHIRSEAFPDLSEVYSGLGLEVRDKEIHFLDAAAYASMRDRIMTPNSGEASASR